MQKMYC